mmetsp:Transcript_23277/g.28595  ORF Transcript_23277/g.28595 Transcript_23277/m.28595 type:complete len:633 (-) Transcript_23277:357-2255(-)
MIFNASESVHETENDILTGINHMTGRSVVINRSSLRDDPFSKRKGKTLTWTNVNMTLKSSDHKPNRKLLSDVWGRVPPGKISAIMGPSGAGKTSLLNILSGRAKSRGRITLESKVLFDNNVVNPTKMSTRKQIAFVAQEDSLQYTATPREAILFSAKMRLPRSTTMQELNRLVNRMLHELGLVSCADTQIGGGLIKGISGGEKRRTSIGVEIVVQPSFVLLDEPTSGLDSYSAIQLIHVLKKVAVAGASVLFTIHQPNSEVFSTFDNLILLNRGCVMFQGSTLDVTNYFETRGYPLPPKYNPADWIMHVAQAIPEVELKQANFYQQNPNNLGSGLNFDRASNRELSLGGLNTDQVDLRHVSFLVEVGWLFSREIRNLTRDTVAVASRYGLTFILSILIGLIFNGVGKTDSADYSNFQSRFGALNVVLMVAMFSTAVYALLSFPSERPLFLREYSTNHYSVVSYFVSRLTMELIVTFVQVDILVTVTYLLIGFQMPYLTLLAVVYCLAMSSTAVGVYLGCRVEDPKTAVELLPIVFVPQLLFAGFFVSINLIPRYLRWLQWFCSLTYATRISIVEEFSDCGAGQAEIICNGLLESTNAKEEDLWWFWFMLILLFVVFRLGALYSLISKATKFL